MFVSFAFYTKLIIFWSTDTTLIVWLDSLTFPLSPLSLALSQFCMFTSYTQMPDSNFHSEFKNIRYKLKANRE